MPNSQDVQEEEKIGNLNSFELAKSLAAFEQFKMGRELPSKPHQKFKNYRQRLTSEFELQSKICLFDDKNLMA